MKTILILVFILQVSFSFSQTWPKYYGEPNSYDYSDDCTESYDKGVLMCGNIYIIGNETTQQSWLIKTDINGDTLWTKIVTNEQEFIRSKAIEQTSDGGVLLCGLAYINSATSYPYILKLDACMNQLWCKLFYTPEDNAWVQDIKETETGDIIILVNQFGEGPEETMHLFKLNAYGDVLWKKPYSSGYVHPEGAIPLGKKVTITSNNKYLIAGQVYWEHPWNPGGPKGLRSLFVMVDSIGNEEWVLPFGLQDTIYGQGKNIFELNENKFIGIANRWPIETMQSVLLEFDSLGNVVEYIIPGNEIIDTAITRGVPLYFERIGSLYSLGGIYGNSEQAFSTEILLDTNIFTSVNVINYLQHTNEDEPYTMIISNDEKIISNSTFKESGNWDIALSKLNLNLEYDSLDPGLYTYDSLCDNLPIQSGFISLDGCIITGMEEIPTPDEYYASIKLIPIKAYPNPATDGSITFEFQNTEHHNNIELKCFDMFGKQIHFERVYHHQSESKMDVSSWKKGMYVAIVYSEGLPAGRCKFVVQ